MKTRLLPGSDKTQAKELLITLTCEGRLPDLGAPLSTFVKKCKASGDLRSAYRSTSLFRPETKGQPKRVLFVGIGKPKDLTADKLRRVAAIAQKRAEAYKVASFRLHLDPKVLGDIDAETAMRVITEGLVLGAYQYQKPSKERPKKRSGQSCEIAWAGRAPKGLKAAMDLGRIGAEATCFARDIENMPGNLATPSHLASEARKFKTPGLTVKVLSEADMKRLKMNALLGVSRGSKQPAKLVLMDYKPAGAKQTICVVGKGLTFDSGGISIKPGARMDEMRYDMCGGGAVLGLFHAISKGGMKGAKGKCRIIGVVPCSENMPDADAQKPGDVVTAMDGTTIEILNTDAEGRLILADAIAYAKKTYKPDRMVDLATLTGAVVVALGHEMAGIMGNDDGLIDELIEAGQDCDEPLWQLPLWQVHKDQIKTRFADIANLNSPSHGNGSTSGGAFLSHFAGETPWAHIDIAGAAWGAVAKDYYQHGAVGTAVRTLLHWLRQQ